jgi:hypothetical protein
MIKTKEMYSHVMRKNIMAEYEKCDSYIIIHDVKIKETGKSWEMNADNGKIACEIYLYISACSS